MNQFSGHFLAEHALGNVYFFSKKVLLVRTDQHLCIAFLKFTFLLLMKYKLLRIHHAWHIRFIQ